ncbi:hypothetical protein WFJ11_04015 [Parvimonas micra]|uniref:hypothetical protein n=1 Tax=Parvimonas TaxID=543311 RepID=UPI00020DCB69|nr:MULTISPECIES: hypothetical protein [unclassified Parvimonas]EGL38654.1 hypothetical protein HMPREF9126_0235 [Parvimonas sp. oral taxon 110 str. F0139]MBF1294882.1 hypothetical protein [Parvimonas sp.]MEB3011414.1 hypothetical protein [Parvimonas sp. D2]MEB3086906.1 hypothetical protein [Parvimonas sp. D4]
MNIDFNVIFMTFLIIILVSIQYTLNKILMILKEIKDSEKKRIEFEKNKNSKKVAKEDYFDEQKRGY